MSAFCSGLCNEISRCCYDFYHAPFTKKNLLIGGGVMLGLIIIIIIIVVSTGSVYHQPATAEDILKRYPFVDGANSLSKNLKDLYVNQLELIENGLFTANAVKCKSCQTDFSRLTKGHVATQVFSVTSYCSAQYEDAVSQTLEQIDLIKRIISANKKDLALVNEPADIAKFFTEGKTGVIINVWGGHNIDSRLSVLRMYYDLGVRIMSIVSADPEHPDLICLPPWVNDKKTLSSFGETVIKEMNRLGMVIDLTGSPMDLQQSVLTVTKAPVIFSHSGSSTITSNPLNVDDSVLNSNKEKIGLVMVPFTPVQLDKNSNSSVDTVADHLDKINTILGDTNKLGIGSNFDNMTETTKDLEDVSKFVNLIKLLKDRQEAKDKITWTDSLLENLISHNFIKVFTDIQKVSNLTATPADVLIAEKEIQNKTKCYSDMDIRYSGNIPTAPTTTTTTTKPTTKPTAAPPKNETTKN